MQGGFPSFFDAGVRAKPALAQRKGFALSLNLSDGLSAIPPGIAAFFSEIPGGLKDTYFVGSQ
jgi:hypothetical protein